MSSKLPQHRATSILQVGSFLSERGESPGELLRKLDLPPEVLLGSSVWIDRDVVLKLTAAVEAITGDALMGIHLGSMFDLQNYGMWTERLARSANLGEAFRYVFLHIHQLETGTRMSLYRAGNNAILRSELVGRMAADPRHQYDGHLCVLIKLLQLAAESFEIALRLPHECSQVTEIEDIIGLETLTGCDHAELVFDVAALQLPLAADSLPASRERPRAEQTCREVFRRVSTAVDPERQTVAGIAEELALSVRTMQRHLSAWGFSFEEILDGYRKRMALEQLLNAPLSVTDIAHGLGYSDTAHFTRAFRRWYGVPPRSVRRNGGLSPA